MIVLEAKDYPLVAKVAQKQGFGFSCLYDHFEPYRKEDFMEVLDDWGWTGTEKDKPPWYTGKAWGE